MIIDWVNGKSRLQVMILILWKQKIRELIVLFENISFKHVYSEFNHLADQLFKEALRIEEGHIQYQEFQGKYMIDQGQLQIFQL